MDQQQLDRCASIYEQWHNLARGRDVEGLLTLYADDAIFESPLVPAIMDDADRGMLSGRAESVASFSKGRNGGQTSPSAGSERAIT